MNEQEPEYKTRVCQILAVKVKQIRGHGTAGYSPKAPGYIEDAVNTPLSALNRAQLIQEVILDAAKDKRKVDDLIASFDEFCVEHSIDDCVAERPVSE